MNEVWFSDISDPEEFPSIKIERCINLNWNEVYYTNSSAWIVKTISTDEFKEVYPREYKHWSEGLKGAQESINKMFHDSIVYGTGMTKIEVGCDHKWKHYQGFSEEYEYCEICDEKK